MRVAFDLWGTLVKPNPLLQEVKKNLITQNIVNQLKVNVQDFLDAMDATKCKLNAYHCDDKYTLNLNILRDTLTSKRIINA